MAVPAASPGHRPAAVCRKDRAEWISGRGLSRRFDVAGRTFDAIADERLANRMSTRFHLNHGRVAALA